MDDLVTSSSKMSFSVGVNEAGDPIKEEDSATYNRRQSRDDSASSNSSTDHGRHRVHTTRQEKSPFPEKVPYFIDPQREEDRLRAKYKRSHQRTRREGSKSASREDVPVKPASSGSATYNRRQSRGDSTSSNSSSDHGRHRVHTTRQEKSPSPKKKKTPEKSPYFIVPEREEDRLRAKYELSHQHYYKTRSRSKSRRRTRRRSRSRSVSKSRSRIRSHCRRRHTTRSRSRDRTSGLRRSSSKDRSRSKNCDKYRSSLDSYQDQRFIPVAIPFEYPCSGGLIAPPIPPYPINPYMMRPMIPPPTQFYPVRPPYVPMYYPRRPKRYRGRHIRPYRPGP